MHAGRQTEGQTNINTHTHTHTQYQNEFCAEGGKLHDAVKGVMESTDMLANSVAVCAAARAKGCKIMHTPITFAADGADWPAALPIRVHVCGAGAREGVNEKTRQWERGRGAEGESSHAANREHRIPSCQ